MTPSTPPFHVIHITAPLKNERGGDVDYTTTLVQEMQRNGISAQYLRGLNDISANAEDALLHLLALQDECHCRGEKMILHIQLRPPRGGTLLPPDFLDNFDHTVVTLHEFSDLATDNQRDLAINYLRQADRVIFTTPHEREFVAQHYPLILSKSHVIPVHPTVPINMRDPADRGNCHNIICFGAIRRGKGQEEAVHLGELIQQDKELLDYVGGDPNQLPKVIIVGSAISGTLVRELVEDIYGLSMPKIVNGRKNNTKAYREILHRHIEAGGKPLLPVELYLDVPREDLPALFERATFAYQPIKRGASHHSTVIPTVLSAGLVCLTTRGPFTPEEYGHGAMIFTSSPKDALDAVKQRIFNPALNIDTRRKAQELMSSLSVENSAAKHATAYSSLVQGIDPAQIKFAAEHTHSIHPE